MSVDSSNFELRNSTSGPEAAEKIITYRVRIRISVGDSCRRLVLLQLADYRCELTRLVESDPFNCLPTCNLNDVSILRNCGFFRNLTAFGHPDEVILCSPVASFSSPRDIERRKRRMLRCPHGGVKMANCNSPNH